MCKATTPLSESSPHLASQAESHAKPIQSAGPSVKQEEAGGKAGGESYRPMIWDGFVVQRTGAADRDWDPSA